MSDNANDVLSAALGLSESDRFALVEGLLASLPTPGMWDVEDPLFAAELERRSADGSPGLAWDDVRSRLESSSE